MTGIYLFFVLHEFQVYTVNLSISKMCIEIEKTIIIFRGAPIRIFEADYRKQYLPIRSPIPILLKSSFYVELFIVILQLEVLDIYSGPEFHF